MTLRSCFWLHAAIAVSVLTSSVMAADANSSQQAREILARSGVKGGLVVHVGCSDGALTAALQINDSFQVHGVTQSPRELAAARKTIRELGKYGPVAVSDWDGTSLPYIDNSVNLLYVAHRPNTLTDAELLRVLVPDGVAYVETSGEPKLITKPRPDTIDDWTHFLHSPGGNAVAHDSQVGPPKHLQWLGSPRWSRHHDRMASMSALVTANGRMFMIMDEGSRVSIQLPAKWKLIARDAFNGVILWKKDIPTWHSHLWPLKSGPTQLARRLVAVGDRVYVTLGIDAPVVCLDAATGEVVHEFAKSAAGEELVVEGDHLFAVVNEGELQVGKFKPEFNTGDQGRVAKEWRWDTKPRFVAAFDVKTGQPLWRFKSPVTPLTMSVNDTHVVFDNGERIIALKRDSGEVAWQSDAVSRRSAITANFGPRLVLWKDVVLFAGGDRKMHGYQLATGKHLWTADHGRSGYQSPEDLLVVKGLVWATETTSGRDSGVYTGRDPHTGEIKVEFPPNVSTYWFHHRCYIAKATDKYILPSRTGIEFVDHESQNWQIHHWVRGGCLYGIMPANGLVYAPPHDCFCYPEAKLFGFNALAPAGISRQIPEDIGEAGRLQHGPAYDEALSSEGRSDSDWPTHRQNNARSGSVNTTVPAKPTTAWETKIGGNLSAVTVAGGQLYVAEIDAHTVHALDTNTGKPAWSYTAGARVDSPPTIVDGRCVFGSADGYVYCLRASDGALLWRFRGAPVDRRLMSFEQLESVWPIHGSVLVEDNAVWCVAGRSNFLDEGLRLLKLNLATGEKLLEETINEIDPENGENLQNRLQTLQMPTGLADILSSSNGYLFMRSQQIDKANGKRIGLGPHSGDAQQQGSVQRGETAHLFSPNGFLDGSYFHRAYWVFGRSYAGGHNGYYQAGKHAPAGRLLVNDEEQVYGFGRKPQYYKWTTTLEHQLFAANKMPPEIPAAKPVINRRGKPAGGSFVQVKPSETLNPTGKAVSVSAWVNPSKPGGVIVCQGGPAEGFALYLQQRKPRFAVRSGGELTTISADTPLPQGWSHVTAVLAKDKTVTIWLNGRSVATGKAHALLTSNPAQSLDLGSDTAGAVGNYKGVLPFTGLIDEVRVFHGELSADEIATHAAQPGANRADNAELVLSLTFDKQPAKDKSGKNNNGVVTGAKQVAGKVEKALAFSGTAPAGSAGGRRPQAYHVKHDWTEDVPLYARGMVLAGDTLFVMGPPDTIDEEESFNRLRAGDPEIEAILTAQAKALDGASGSVLLAVNKQDGKTIGSTQWQGLPVWDGLAAANGHLYLATTDGRVLCLGEK